MKNNHKLLTLTCLTTIASGVIYVINKVISAGSIINNILEKPKSNSYFNWRFGKVYYTKKGSGSPVLLVHDLIPGGSGYEWHKVEDNLSKSHTVYTLDLLGCGRSEKPAMTYTNFVYSQLLCDFIKDIIKEKSSIIATGLSASTVVTACNLDQDLFDQCILVNPSDLSKLNRIPTKNTKTQKLLIEFPIIGTMLYNIFMSMFHVEHLFMENYFFNPFHMDKAFMESYHEASHIGDGAGKYLYASLVGGYLNFNIQHNLQSINNSIVIVYGDKESDAEKNIENYRKYNPSIEHVKIKNSKHFPHIEKPDEFMENTKIYLEKEV